MCVPLNCHGVLVHAAHQAAYLHKKLSVVRPCSPPTVFFVRTNILYHKENQETDIKAEISVLTSDGYPLQCTSAILWLSLFSLAVTPM